MLPQRLTWCVAAASLLGACAVDAVPAAPQREPQGTPGVASAETRAPTPSGSPIRAPGATADSGPPTPPGTTSGASTPATAFAALSKYGAVEVTAAERRFEIALAMLPRTFSKGGLYEYEGPNYPTTPEARAALFDQVAWTYAALAQECAARHPEIVLPKPDQNPSESELSSTLQAVAACAYADFGIKPYWIPRLLADVDACERKLGSDWHLPTVDQVKGMSQAERAAVVATLREGLYNGLEIFALGPDKSVQVANLETGTSRALSEVNATYQGDTYHYEGNAALRCIRGAIVTVP